MREGQVYIVKESQRQEGIPERITIKSINGDELVITSTDGEWLSNLDIINSFYDLEEEFNAENMPKLTIQAIDDVLALIEVLVSTGNGLAGLQAKTKLIVLKSDIETAIGLKPAAPVSLLGRKLV